MNCQRQGVQAVFLGEMFSCPYSHKMFKEHAEYVPHLGKDESQSPGVVTTFISAIARETGLWVVAGSVPEIDSTVNPPKFYNTSVVLDSSGLIVGKYRKTHLFDVDIPGDPQRSLQALSFQESKTFTPGDLGPCLVKTPWGFDIGLGICYDIRFPEYAITLRELSNGGMKLLVYPGSFNLVTGPLHWELLGRARAVDSQSFCILASTARTEASEEYQSWGHSMVIAPNGRVMSSLQEKEGLIVADLDLAEVDLIRQSIPTFKQKRRDLYII